MGAVYTVGTVLLQVSQPCRPCCKLAAHHDIADMAAEVHRVVNIDRDDAEGAQRLLRHADLLPESWVKLLRRRLDGHLEDQAARLEG